MPIAIFLDFDADKMHLRPQARPHHLQYQKDIIDKMVAAGPLMDETTDIPYGGMIVMATEDIAEAEAMCRNDPYTKAGIIKGWTFFRWSKTIFDHQDMTG